MKTLLITGFEPFGGETINPAWEAVKALPEQIGGWQLRKLQIPTVFGLAAARTLACAAECRPDAVLCIGQAGTRSAVTPEYVGINLRHARIADNLGNQPQDEPVVPGGPTAYFATVPVRAMTAAIEAQGIPAAVSYTAGTYVCNDLLYTLLQTVSGQKVHLRNVFAVAAPAHKQQACTGQVCGNGKVNAANTVRAPELFQVKGFRIVDCVKGQPRRFDGFPDVKFLAQHPGKVIGVLLCPFHL